MHQKGRKDLKMKAKSTISVILVTLIISIPITSLVTIRICNIESLKFFSRDIVNNIIKRQILDEVWDYEKKTNIDKTGYDLWIIGKEDGNITAAKVASGPVVELDLFNPKELDMKYKSINDYDKQGGHEKFRAFIESYYIDGSK